MPIKRSGVEIVDRKTDEAIEFVDCRGGCRKSCEHVEKGILINLNHADFKTRIVVEETPT